MQQTAGPTVQFAVLVVLAVLVAFLVGRTLASLDPFTIQHATPVLSALDSTPYRVHAGCEASHPDPQQAADMMAKLNQLMVDVQEHLRAKYVAHGSPFALPDPRYAARQRAVRLILRNYNQDNLVENSHRDPEGDTSYSLDKGRVLAFCMRDKETGHLHRFHMLAFVALHEMAHLGTQEHGHPPVFWDTFCFILNEAHQAGIYTSPNFARHPERYCGMTVNYNPAWDPNAPSI